MVVGRPHPEWDETVVTMIVLAKDAALTEDMLKEFLAERLPKYKIPREFNLIETLSQYKISREFNLIETLSHTPTGKVMKYNLREEL